MTVVAIDASLDTKAIDVDFKWENSTRDRILKGS
jgi:hypothetical protein